MPRFETLLLKDGSEQVLAFVPTAFGLLLQSACFPLLGEVNHSEVAFGSAERADRRLQTRLSPLTGIPHSGLCSMMLVVA